MSAKPVPSPETAPARSPAPARTPAPRHSGGPPEGKRDVVKAVAFFVGAIVLIVVLRVAFGL